MLLLVLSPHEKYQQGHGDGAHGQCYEWTPCFQPHCQGGDKGPDIKIVRAKFNFTPGGQDAYGSEGAKNSGSNE